MAADHSQATGPRQGENPPVGRMALVRSRGLSVKGMSAILRVSLVLWGALQACDCGGGSPGDAGVRFDFGPLPEAGGRLVARPELIELGPVLLGETGTATLAVWNVGTKNAVIRAPAPHPRTPPPVSTPVLGEGSLHPPE